MKCTLGIQIPGSHPHRALCEIHRVGKADSVHVARVLDIRRNSACAALRRLRDAGLIRIVGTAAQSADGPRPFVYAPAEARADGVIGNALVRALMKEAA